MKKAVLYLGFLICCSFSLFSQDKDEHLDNRIIYDLKNIQPEEVLDIFKKIPLFEIKYLDTTRYYSYSQVKIPTQQLEQVYPNAIAHDTGYIPDIYAYPTSFKYDATNLMATISLEVDHGLSLGEKVKLIGQDRIQTGEVVEVIDYNTFSMELIWEPKKPFVYGRWVDDLAAVDYEAIAGLHILTTQHLVNRVSNLETALEALKAEIQAIKESGK